MRVPLSWVSELTPLDADPRDDAAVAELRSALDSLGLVVENIEHAGQGLEEVVTAQVLEIGAIEGADRIRRVVVGTGPGATTEVVCGAWNFAVGDVVVLAPVGSVLPGDFRIERRKIRGVVSNGMICSGRELTLSDEHAGILVLASPGEGTGTAGVELGIPLAEHLGFGYDVVFDLDVEANRPDCLSILGVARDLAARFGLPLTVPEPRSGEPGKGSAGSSGSAGAGLSAGDLATVEVLEPDLCPRFLACVLTGVRPAPSPLLVQRRLTLAGMRPIGHVVDASNYVMLELGQPTHPYDLDRVEGGLRVRSARPGESIVTLDGEMRRLGDRPPRGGDELTSRDALICDGRDEPVGIAGIMGGTASEISESTSRVLLEVARFDSVSVGRTARHIGLRTEASQRFERGVDPEGLQRAASRLCELVVSAACAAGLEPPVVAPGVIDVNPRPFRRSRVWVRPERANRLLGLALSADEVVGLLRPIGYEGVGTLEAPGLKQGGGVAKTPAGRPGPGHGLMEAAAGPVTKAPEAVTGATVEEVELIVPSWRPDVQHEADVIEDVARTYGYRRIPTTHRSSPYVGRLDPLQQLRRRLRRVLAGLGAHEAWTSSVVSAAEQQQVGLDGPYLELANPMVSEDCTLRGSLLPGLLAALRHNEGHRNASIRLFEIGDVFAVSGHDEESGVPYDVPYGVHDESFRASAHESWPSERERVGLILAREGDDAATAVGCWRTLCDAVGIAGSGIRQPGSATAGAQGGGGAEEASQRAVPQAEGLHPARRGWLVAGGSVLGVVGEIDPEVLGACGLARRRVGWLELDLGLLLAAPRVPDLAIPVSRYPSSDVDLAFGVKDDVPAASVEAVLRHAAGELLESIELFDVYRGGGVEAGSRSLAFRMRLCSPERTLTDAEVGTVRARCIEAVENSLPAVLRGS